MGRALAVVLHVILRRKRSSFYVFVYECTASLVMYVTVTVDQKLLAKLGLYFLR